jgi:hypothetical protein
MVLPIGWISSEGKQEIQAWLMAPISTNHDFVLNLFKWPMTLALTLVPGAAVASLDMSRSWF